MEDVSFRLASALLMHQGQISVSEIKSLPFVDDEQTALAIAQRLMQSYPTYILQREVKRTTGLPMLDDVIVLQSPRHQQANVEYNYRSARNTKGLEQARSTVFRESEEEC